MTGQRFGDSNKKCALFLLENTVEERGCSMIYLSQLRNALRIYGKAVHFLLDEHKPTLRAFSVLELVSAREESYTLSEISRSLGISTSTLLPILHTLRKQKYLGFDEKTQSYSLGMRLFELGSRVQTSVSYQKIDEIMQGIVSACEETCHFATLDGGDVFYLAKVEAEQPVRLSSMLGRRLPAYAAASGKALLKHHTIAQLKALYPEGLKPRTMHTITDFEKFHAQLDAPDIFYYEQEEGTDAVCSVAVPIYRNGSIVAACSVAVPVYRYDAQKQLLIEQALRKALIAFEKIVHTITF